MPQSKEQLKLAADRVGYEAAHFLLLSKGVYFQVTRYQDKLGNLFFSFSHKADARV